MYYKNKENNYITFGSFNVAGGLSTAVRNVYLGSSTQAYMAVQKL